LVFVYVKEDDTLGALNGKFHGISGQFIVVRRPLGDLVWIDRELIRRIEVGR